MGQSKARIGTIARRSHLKGLKLMREMAAVDAKAVDHDTAADATGHQSVQPRIAGDFKVFNLTDR